MRKEIYITFYTTLCDIFLDSSILVQNLPKLQTILLLFKFSKHYATTQYHFSKSPADS